ncbi:tetratricopeptide repeat protein [Burkholderia gladioli]|uniref:O-linked N-acetylglucosamine transferase family protein n=1 Tax=Burkholderia gladioli TaxID=28095 RepID=UPI002FDFC02F
MSESTPSASQMPDQQFDADIALVLDSALASHHRGEFAEARTLYELILSTHPQHADARYNLAVLKVQTGEPAAALPDFEVVLGLSPHNGQYWVSYIDAQIEAGRIAAAWTMLGMCQKFGVHGPAVDGLVNRLSLSAEGKAAIVSTAAAGQPVAAAASASPAETRTVTFSISTATPQAGQGTIQAAAQAARAVQAPVARKPTPQDVNRFTALYNKGRFEEAIKLGRQLAQRYPDHAWCWKSLGNALHQHGEYLASIEPLAKATELDPADVLIGTLYADVLRLANRLVDSERESRRLLQIDPDFAETHRVLGMSLLAQGRIQEAIEAGRRSVELAPNSLHVHGSLAVALSELGATAEAEASFRRAHEIAPRDAAMHSNLLFCMTHNPGLDAERLYAEHRRFAEIHEAPVRARWPRHANQRDPERQLRIGLISGDLFNHAVSSYLMPILEALKDDPTLSLHVYHNHTVEDAVSERMRACVRSWTTVAGLSDDRLVQRIRDDRIDIMMDLSNHTGRNRLPALARKPAPVQVTWLGYPGTTGLDAIDYHFADRFGVPFGEMERQYSEKTVHLPAGGTFKPAENAPPVNLLPALHNGYVTFGSFNRLNKLRHDVIAVWARILHAVPGSRMRIGSIPRDGGVDMLLGWFSAEGISHDRLDLQPRAPAAVYLQQHHHVDFCLDTFPYTGSTTALNALWMGVPTLTIRGDTLASRAGAVWMSSVGLEQFVADDVDDFVARAIALAGDLKGLAALRGGMRERCRQSAGFQPERVAQAVSDSFRIAWRRWCAGEAPIPFTAPDRGSLATAATESVPRDAEAAALTGEAR